MPTAAPSRRDRAQDMGLEGCFEPVRGQSELVGAHQMAAPSPDTSASPTAPAVRQHRGALRADTP